MCLRSIAFNVSVLAGIELHPITLLSGLLNTEKEMLDLHARLKLSRFERDLGLFVIANRGDKIHPVLKRSDLRVCIFCQRCLSFAQTQVKIRPYQFLVVDNHQQHKDCKEWAVETLKYRGDTELASELEQWQPPR